jgi:hypothetical protein
MIDIFTGMPRNGKTLGAVRRILQELVGGHAQIVTNIQLNMGEVADYVASRNPLVDVRGRVYILQDGELLQFWRYRLPVHKPGTEYPDPLVAAPTYCWGPGDYRQIPPAQKGDKPPLPDRCDFSSIPDGMEPFHLYVIDEAHLVFGSREWQNQAKELMFVASQHGKLRSDWVLITQTATFLDRQLTGLCQSVTHFSNGNLQKLMPGVRAPKVVRWQNRLGIAYNAPVQDKGSWKIEPDVFRCYDTTAGVGMMGGQAPVESRPTGVPWWVLLGALPLIVLAFWGFDRGSSWGLRKVVKNGMDTITPTLPGALPSPASAAASVPPPPLALSGPSPLAQIVRRQPVQLDRRGRQPIAERQTGYMRTRINGVTVETWSYSSGRVITLRDGVREETPPTVIPDTPPPPPDGIPSAGPVIIPRGGRDVIPGAVIIPGRGRRMIAQITNDIPDVVDLDHDFDEVEGQ